MASRLGARFEEAVQAVLRVTAAGGVLLVAGVGKSGLIGAKLSATLASTGTPSHPLDPVEAAHGGLGRVRPGDAVLLLSHSGDTAELVALAERLADDGVLLLSITGGRGGQLAALADVALSVGEVREAPPLGLAPSASSTATLALGDALALCCAEARGLRPHRLPPLPRRRRAGADDDAGGGGPALPLRRPGGEPGGRGRGAKRPGRL